MFDYALAYGIMHQSDKHFRGKMLQEHVNIVANLVRETEAKTLLDYGSGKGGQYLGQRVHEDWGGILPYCYDIGVPYLSQKPQVTVDGVICTDMMEHIAEEDVDEVLADIFGFLAPNKPVFAFFSISCHPSRKTFRPIQNGNPAHGLEGQKIHLTTQPPEWWEAKLAPYRSGFVRIVAIFDAKATRFLGDTQIVEA